MTQQIAVIDLTGDEPVITYVNQIVRPPRRPLGEISTVLADQAVNTDTTIHRRRNRRRSSTAEVDKENMPQPQEGRGHSASSNPWIQHVKDFAKEKGITYWEALKSPQCKSSYQKSQGGKGILDDIKRAGHTVGDAFKIGKHNPFDAGYKFGHDTLGPAIFGKKR